MERTTKRKKTLLVEDIQKNHRWIPNSSWTSTASCRISTATTGTCGSLKLILQAPRFCTQPSWLSQNFATLAPNHCDQQCRDVSPRETAL